MRNYIFVLVLMSLTSVCYGFNPIEDVRQHTKLHLFDNVLPSTFFDFTRQDFYGGVLTEVISYRFLGALTGVQKNLATSRRYEPVVSLGLRLDYFGNRWTAKLSQKSPLFSRMAIGPYVGYTYADGHMVYGVAATVRFKINHSEVK